MSSLKHFVLWLDVPVEHTTNVHIQNYIDLLIERMLKPKTINSYLDSIRGFFEYLREEEDLHIPNPVKRGYALKLPKPLPRYLKDHEVDILLETIEKPRDRAMFYLMLRSGIRVEELSLLALSHLDLKRRKVLIEHGKGGKDRVVYISNDACLALLRYLEVRPSSESPEIFLVEKGTYKGTPISIRGIQKRMEYYSKKVGLKVCCHRLRHTMATQLLNADADLTTIQDLLGHSRIKTTERYTKISNLKVERDYYKAMSVVMKKMKGTPMNR